MAQRGGNRHGQVRGICGDALAGGDFQWVELKHAQSSDAFEVFERLETGAAAVQRLARRGAEFADAFSIGRTAAGTAHGSGLSQDIAHGSGGALPGGDASTFEPAPAVG